MASRGFIKLNYGQGANLSVATYWVSINTLLGVGVPHDLVQNDDSLIDFQTAISDWVALIDAFFNTGVDFSTAQLWSQPTDTDNPVFVEQVIVADNGVSATATNLYSQMAIMLYNDEGTVSRLQFMNTIFAVNSIENFPITAVSVNDVVNYAIGVNGFIRSKRGAKFVAPKRYTTKTNDALRKRGQNL